MAAVESHLGSLPFELKFKLLKTLPDISTLSNLVHASPAYHELYAANCETIFTAVTINELEGKGIDILKPTPFVLVRMLKRASLRLLELAVIHAREQHLAGKAIKLKIPLCLNLLTILGWKDLDPES